MNSTTIISDKDDYSVLSARELAERLHIGRDKAYALIKSKSFPSIKLGGRYIVTAKALNEWLDQYQYKTFAM
ncbi:MAG: helix-turn-helix domain-containing protein [Lachnospiraceae bacterium]|nr:helix-turn-helix domain-containing protein [Lachnospiraceae bacterium]